MEHESDTFTNVAALRANADQDYDFADIKAVEQHFADVAKLDSGLGKFMIQVEDYPDLKADGQMMKAQMTYNEIEEHIAAARRFYNATVKELNNYIEIFPGSLIAPYANATMLPFYETDELSRAPVDAADYLK
tara:strand:- start:151 stop:549 length:399 start_codon:yes stop_codon:yes gene_type:complete